MLNDFVTLLAQTSAATPAPKQAPPGAGNVLMIGFLLMIVVFYFVLFRGNKKQKQQREQLMNSLSKNTRVMTIGGVLGTVVSVRDNEVVLKVDESTNTKMTFLKSAIQKVISEGESPAG